MRLQRATTMSRLRGERDETMGLFRSREERQERREERRERRQERRSARKEKRRDRRENRLERKAEKLRERQERLEERAEQPTRRERRQERRAERRETREERREDRQENRQERRAERRGDAPRAYAAVAPMPHRRRHPGYPQDPGYTPPDAWTDDGSFPPEDEDVPPMEEGEAELEPVAEESAEGLGWNPIRRRNTVTAAPPAPVAAPRAVAPQVPATWSPPARMGAHLRIQASAGFRAAVVELRPGLFVVAEIPADVARSEVGFAPLIAPLMIRAASRAAQRQGQPLYQQQPDGNFVQVQTPERRGLLSAFRQPAQPVAALPGPVAQPQAAWNTAPAPWQQQPLAALPGPVAQAAPVEPVPEAPVSGPLVVAVPRIARWADAEDVAGVLADPRFRGRR